jgi:uncharacterized protein with HEPN domain
LRHDDLYLNDIIEAADAIGSFLADVSEEDFIDNELLRSAVLQKLITIGEAATRIGLDLKARHPEIEWSDIVAFRNIAVHAYFSVSWPIVWVTATQDVPTLRKQIVQVMDTEKPGGPR